jgi:hypothetical protein
VVVAERLRERLAWVVEKGDVPHFTVSMGIVAAADTALLEAKAAGRDIVVLAPPRQAAADPDSSITALPIRPAGASTAV